MTRDLVWALERSYTQAFAEFELPDLLDAVGTFVSGLPQHMVVFSVDLRHDCDGTWTGYVSYE